MRIMLISRQLIDLELELKVELGGGGTSFTEGSGREASECY